MKTAVFSVIMVLSWLGFFMKIYKGMSPKDIIVTLILEALYSFGLVYLTYL